MLAVVELLRKNKNLCGMLAWNDNDAILIGDDDVVHVVTFTPSQSTGMLTPPNR